MDIVEIILQIIIAAGSIIALGTLIFQMKTYKFNLKETQKKEYCNTALTTIQIIKKQEKYINRNFMFNIIQEEINGYNCYQIKQLEEHNPQLCEQAKRCITFLESYQNKYTPSEEQVVFEETKEKLEILNQIFFKSEENISALIDKHIRLINEYKEHIESALMGYDVEKLLNGISVNSEEIALYEFMKKIQKELDDKTAIKTKRESILSNCTELHKAILKSVRNS